jgi:probable rRNA maturation factor
MILLDPDLDPDADSPAPNSKRASSTRPTPVDRNARVPSARTLARFLREAQAAVRLGGQVSVLLTTDRKIRQLNRDFRGKDKATDVLSFPAARTAGEDVAGDLAVSVPTALRQACEQGHALAVELKVLLLHGLLHLAGFDHERDSGEMARRERRLREKLGLPQGLIERSDVTPEGGGPRRSLPKRGIARKASADPSTKATTATSLQGATQLRVAAHRPLRTKDDKQLTMRRGRS